MAIKIDQYIQKLNEIRAAEMRMSLVYHRLSELVTGPWRDALAGQFAEHAKHETKHAELAMRRIVALGGEIGTDVEKIPEWESLDEILDGLQKLEVAGIQRWQALHDLLDNEDAFRHVISGVLAVEQEHLDEAKRWRGEVAAKGESIKEDTAGPAEDDIVGDKRRVVVYGISPDLSEDSPIIGEAWQDDDGNLVGTGICGVMLFEPLSIKMYRALSIGMDVSPLSILALRLSNSPFTRIEWSDLQ